jgi:AcrR family transcriptional regulator
MPVASDTNSSTGKRGTLNKTAVLRAAVLLADETGVASLSMRKLAEKLGVEAMSLYYHVANKDEILDGMVDSIFTEVELPAREEDWKTAMRKRAFSVREVLLRHRWAVSLMESRPNPGPATLQHHESVIRCLREGGFSIAMAAHAFSTLDSYIYGFVMQEQSLPFQTPEELEVVAEAILKQMPRDEFPYFTEMILEYNLKLDYSYANEFEIGLDLILDGLERMAQVTQ